MTIRRIAPRLRRGIAASAIVLSLGGLVLFRTPATAASPSIGAEDLLNGTAFSGPGAAGTLALSHGKVLANGRQRIFAELRLRADAAEVQFERAPIALTIVLDTSGSMEGDKIAEARQSVLRMLDEMRDDDEIALVRYDDNPELLQSMARVGDVRERVRSRVMHLRADGGTNIPAALSEGVDALRDASSGRVRRLVLVSDGLDSTRHEAERLARTSTDRGITVSALGIGLDFDESYMASVARAGRGNFGFVENGAALAEFLKRELVETAATKVEKAVARMRLPRGLRFVQALGADAKQLGDGELLLRLGALHAGDERRVVVELIADASLAETLALDTTVSWDEVSGESISLDLQQLGVTTTSDPALVEATRDARVWASCLSAIASRRQLDAADAYRRGDAQRAQQITADNIRDLEEAAAAAPKPVADRLRKQRSSYADTADAFTRAPSGSAAGRAAAKKATEADTANLARERF
jgi:Ca-activated chloride channel homolog